MKENTYWIKNLNMTSHPEGGYYTLTYTSPHEISDNELLDSFSGKRALSTSIYFLIHEGEVSNFHRLKADEIWYFHDGQPLTVSVITPEGDYIEHKLGLNFENGERPQVLVPAGSIFGSFVEKGYALVGCMVSYGFDFEDFELFTRSSLLSQYPQHEEIITRLTRAET